MITEQDCCVLQTWDGKAYPAIWHVEGKCGQCKAENRKTLVHEVLVMAIKSLNGTLALGKTCTTEAMCPMHECETFSPWRTL